MAAPEGKYRGVRDVFAHLMREEGIRAMYRGAVPVMLRWEVWAVMLITLWLVFLLDL